MMSRKNRTLQIIMRPVRQRIPVIIGDLKEGIWYFDRAKTTIMTSNIASIGDLNAFAEDLTIYRAIEREDIKIRDKAVCKCLSSAEMMVNKCWKK